MAATVKKKRSRKKINGMVKLSILKSNPNNPRLIKDEKFKKLVTSIKDFPQMMALRPIIIDENSMVLGGNMRMAALKELGYMEVPTEWVKRASELTEEQKREFIIKDNVSFGEMDWDAIANLWDAPELIEWGVDMNFFNPKNDPNKEWEGMPEFINNDLKPLRTIHIHFKTEEAVIEFEKLMNQKIFPTINYLWFPKADLIDMSSTQYHDES